MSSLTIVVVILLSGCVTFKVVSGSTVLLHQCGFQGAYHPFSWGISNLVGLELESGAFALFYNSLCTRAVNTEHFWTLTCHRTVCEAQQLNCGVPKKKNALQTGLWCGPFVLWMELLPGILHRFELNWLVGINISWDAGIMLLGVLSHTYCWYGASGAATHVHLNGARLIFKKYEPKSVNWRDYI